MLKNNIKTYDKYKDSGIEWIGEIPQDWNIRKLFGLLNTIGSGTTPKGNDDYYDGQIGWLNTGDLNDSFIYNTSKTITDLAMRECSTLKIFKAGSVVIAMYGATVGKLGILKIPTTTNQACCVMSCNTLLNNKYLFYSLYSAKDFILTLSYGSGQPNISQETIKSFKLCNPSISEQQQIADYLDKKCGEIDRVVEIQKDIIEKLKEYKQSVISEAVTKGLDKSVSLKDSGIEWIGKIPEHWRVSKIKSEYKLQTGGTPDTKILEYYEGNNKWVTIADMNSSIIYETNAKITDDAVKSCSMNISPKGSLMFSFKLSIGKVAFCGEDIYTNEAIATFLPNTNPLAYLYYIASIFIIKNANENIYGAKLLNQQLIKEAKIILPPIEEQRQIAEYLDKKCSEIDSAISDKEKLIEKLTEYKKSLIYECVTGKRNVVRLD
jgi:type I restriction enzyme S subunit